MKNKTNKDITLKFKRYQHIMFWCISYSVDGLTAFINVILNHVYSHVSRVCVCVSCLYIYIYTSVCDGSHSGVVVSLVRFLSHPPYFPQQREASSSPRIDTVSNRF